MAGAKDIQGTVFQAATATFMARVEGSSGLLLDQAAVASVQYTINEVNQAASQHASAILGHENVSIDKTIVVFNTLQTDSTWTIDATGYNFRHEIDVSQFEAFPRAGQIYQVRYEITPVARQKIVFRYRVRCI